MRLRPLTEAECYARCYGGRHDESVSLLSDEHEPERAPGLAAADPGLATGADPAGAREAA